MTAMTRATFYFDLGSPYAYLAAERLDEVLPDEPVAWRPVSLGALFKLADRGSWSLGDPERRRAGMAEVQRRATAYGLPAVRWPDPWPGNYLMAMRAATYAERTGRGREFARSAYRRAFQQGNDLSVPSHLLAAAADAGLDPRDTETATQDPEIKLALRQATDAAHDRGVFGVPTIAWRRPLRASRGYRPGYRGWTRAGRDETRARVPGDGVGREHGQVVVRLVSSTPGRVAEPPRLACETGSTARAGDDPGTRIDRATR